MICVVTSIQHAYFPIYLHHLYHLCLQKYSTLKKCVLYNLNEYNLTEIFYSFKFTYYITILKNQRVEWPVWIV